MNSADQRYFSTTRRTSVSAHASQGAVQAPGQGVSSPEAAQKEIR